MFKKIILTIMFLALVSGLAVFAQQGKKSSSTDNHNTLTSNSISAHQPERTFTK